MFQEDPTGLLAAYPLKENFWSEFSVASMCEKESLCWTDREQGGRRKKEMGWRGGVSLEKKVGEGREGDGRLE